MARTTNVRCRCGSQMAFGPVSVTEAVECEKLIARVRCTNPNCPFRPMLSEAQEMLAWRRKP